MMKIIIIKKLDIFLNKDQNNHIYLNSFNHIIHIIFYTSFMIIYILYSMNKIIIYYPCDVL